MHWPAVPAKNSSPCLAERGDFHPGGRIGTCISSFFFPDSLTGRLGKSKTAVRKETFKTGGFGRDRKKMDRLVF